MVPAPSRFWYMGFIFGGFGRRGVLESWTTKVIMYGQFIKTLQAGDIRGVVLDGTIRLATREANG
jgi:hypothetical protein